MFFITSPRYFLYNVPTNMRMGFELYGSNTSSQNFRD